MADTVVYEVGMNSRTGAIDAARRLLASSEPPTALICLSDEIALGALHAVTELKLDVPADVSITGFDGTAAARSAGLTTVRQSAAEKGRRAWEVVDRAETRQVLVPHALEIGRTTGPVPAR